MNDRDLQKLLRALPREQARPGFARDVLAKLDEPARDIGVRWTWPRVLLAASTAVVALVVVPWAVHGALESRSIERNRSDLAALRAEHESLTRELRALIDLDGAQAGGVVYLGGNDAVDVVFDIDGARRMLASRGTATEPVRFDRGDERR